MDFANVFEEDIETWAETQVAALRRLAHVPGPWANFIDWENVIEEIEDLGSERREAVESLMEQAFAPLLELCADPDSLSAEHWRNEIGTFLKQACKRAKLPMRSRIDMDEVWRRSLDRASAALGAFDRKLPPDVSPRCPFSFDDICDPIFDPLADLRKWRRVKPDDVAV